MLPARTGVPAYTFTPRRWALEPRPLRVEPAPFLCAMALSSGLDSGDLELGIGLPVPLLASVVLAAAELEDDDLLGPVLPQNFGADRGTLYERLADLGSIAPQEKNLIEAQ